jgi:threonine/homoserine/homoserine lactone efflux protein
MPNAEMILDWFWLIATGFSFGFIAAAPIGAVNIICIRRTLHYGPLNGFLSGLGAALGDGFFAALVAFGFTSLSDWIADHTMTLELVGGLILVGYAIYALFTEPPIRRIEEKGELIEEHSGGIWSAAASTFGLTAINPATFFFFAAVAATLSSLVPAGASSYAAAGTFVAAVILGSTLWWAVIVSITYFAHKQIGDRSIVVINRVTGVLIGVFGLFVLANMMFGPWVR